MIGGCAVFGGSLVKTVETPSKDPYGSAAEKLYSSSSGFSHRVMLMFMRHIRWKP